MIARLSQLTQADPYRHMLWSLNNAIVEKLHEICLNDSSQIVANQECVLEIARDLLSALKELEIWSDRENSGHRYKYWPLTSPFFEYEYASCRLL
jgi:hypothetical protein